MKIGTFDITNVYAARTDGRGQPYHITIQDNSLMTLSLAPEILADAESTWSRIDEAMLARVSANLIDATDSPLKTPLNMSKFMHKVTIAINAVLDQNAIAWLLLYNPHLLLPDNTPLRLQVGDSTDAVRFHAHVGKL